MKRYSKLILIIIVLIFAKINNGFSQQMFKEKGENCPLQFEMEQENIFINYEPNDSILIYDLLDGLDDKKIKKIKGVLMAQITIDTAFNVCCVSYTNKTNLPKNKPTITERLVNMKGWKRQVPKNLENTNVCMLIYIFFNKYDYKIQRVGYSRNTGKKILTSKIYKRKKKHINM